MDNPAYAYEDERKYQLEAIGERSQQLANGERPQQLASGERPQQEASGERPQQQASGERPQQEASGERRGQDAVEDNKWRKRVTTTRTMIRQFVALLTIEPMMILQGSKGFSKSTVYFVNGTKFNFFLLS